jgi:hypothetical protein
MRFIGGLAGPLDLSCENPRFVAATSDKCHVLRQNIDAARQILDAASPNLNAARQNVDAA